VLCALAATPAHAARFQRTPIALGPSDGNSPSAVIDAAGTAHFAWGIGEDLIGYCAVPRRARTCAVSARLSLDARAGRPEIVRRPQDGMLAILAGRRDIDDTPDDSVWAFTSADGRAWSAPRMIGAGVGAFDAASLTADGAAVDLLQAGTGVNRFQRAPLAGPPVTRVLDLASRPSGKPTPFDFPGELARLRDGRTLALLGSPASGFAYRVLTGADPFAPAAWTPWPARRVSTEWEEPRAASGPRGAFVMYGVSLVDQVYGAAPQVVRRFRGTRWGRPRGLFYEVAANTDRAALAEDGKGRLHAAIVGYAGAGRRSCIAYARTRKHRWFTRAVSLDRTGRAGRQPGRVRLAVDAAGHGVVTWAATRGQEPSVARAQRLRAGRGVTRPRRHADRACPPYPG
jgi:hypothetical protein